VLPAHLHHDLAAYELAERIDELARLTEQGDVAQAPALAAVVAGDYEAFLAEADAAGIVADDRYLTVLTALLERLPGPAQEAVQAVIDRAPASGGGSSAGDGSTGPSGATTGNASSGNGAALPGAPNAVGEPPDDPSSTAPTPKPTKSPRPEPTPRATPEPSASDGGANGGGGPRSSGSDQDERHDEDQGNQ